MQFICKLFSNCCKSPINFPIYLFWKSTYKRTHHSNPCCSRVNYIAFYIICMYYLLKRTIKIIFNNYSLKGWTSVCIPFIAAENLCWGKGRLGFAFFFFFLALPHGMWDLSSLTRDRTHAPCIGSVWSLNHWTAREVPRLGFSFSSLWMSVRELDVVQNGNNVFTFCPRNRCIAARLITGSLWKTSAGLVPTQPFM